VNFSRQRGRRLRSSSMWRRPLRC